MNNIGFVETNDAQKADVIKSILCTIKNEVREVSKMENETTETVIEDAAETVVEKAVDTDVEKAETETVSKVEEEMTEEEAGEAEETEAESMDEEDDMEEKSAAGGKGYSDELKPTKALVDEIQATFTMLADTIKALNEKVDELNKTVTGVREDVDTVKNEFGKRVDAVEKDTAFRKSGDLGEIVQEPIFIEKAQMSLWGGRFLTKSDLFA
jgi:chromosome segregation ATPase